MIRYKCLMLAALIPFAGAAAQSAKPAVTLDQAVLKVQHDTGGKVLSAESRGIGRRVEYRIKVLTPEGHVKVMAISSEASKNPSSTQSTKTQSTKNPPGRNTGSKEKH
ncbi:MAG: hypothetical protein ABI178_10480 [Rhodanobacter sp.]